ncbi:hypothetical protein ACFQ58_13405 [Agromyces sp. NPDC056523]|uniref:hypothetical protein n=1 Tax=Agromyces sp. NPDC056523 TaxID=3345850 RepID=UPI00366AFED6
MTGKVASSASPRKTEVAISVTQEHAPAHRAKSKPASRRGAANDTDRVPWYRRGKALLLGAGALAGAVLALFGLGDRIFPADQGDVATIESVSMIGQTSFKEFADKQFGVDLPLSPAPADAAAAEAVVLVASASDPAAPVDTSQTAPETLAPLEPDPTLPPEEPVTVRPRTVTPLVPEADPPETNPPETNPPETSAPSTPEESTPPSDGGGPREFVLPETYLHTMASLPVLEEWNFESAELHQSPILGVQPTDENGKPLPPEEVASRVAEVLNEVESTIDAEGDLDPSGWSVGVNLSVEGLQGVPLLLTWSLDGVNVPDDWAAEKVSYRVVASTPRDVGSAEIWIPHLKAAGEYNVNVTLRLESDQGKTLAYGPPLTIVIP